MKILKVVLNLSSLTKVLLFPLCLLMVCYSEAAELKPFGSDGCSAFPDGKPEEQRLWRHCCVAHDLAYWQGGTYKDRLAADKALEACVGRVGEPSVGMLMLVGVRVGGSPFWPTPFRWGYGWPYPRAYGPLTPAEKAQVRASLQQHTLPLVSKDDPFWFAPWVWKAQIEAFDLPHWLQAPAP